MSRAQTLAIAIRACLTSGVLLTCANVVASDTRVVDNDFMAIPVIGGSPVSRIVTLGQTFTSDASGTLNRIELQLSRTDSLAPSVPLEIEIVATDQFGHPITKSEDILAKVELLPFEVPYSPLTTLFTGVELGDQSFEVSLGQQLAIVLSAKTTRYGARYFWSTTNSSYEGGQAFYFHHQFDTGLNPREHQDRGFRTFVTPIPEPKVMSLGVIVSVIFSLIRNRTRI